MQRGLTYLLIIFGLLPLQISTKFFSFYRAPWLKGWAGHTSSTFESELLLVIEYTTKMIVTCTQLPLMSLLESWNWCFFLSPWMLKIFEEDIWFRLPNRRVASFILSFLVQVYALQIIANSLLLSIRGKKYLSYIHLGSSVCHPVCHPVVLSSCHPVCRSCGTLSYSLCFSNQTDQGDEMEGFDGEGLEMER